jgi:hypothetical protein
LRRRGTLPVLARRRTSKRQALTRPLSSAVVAETHMRPLNSEEPPCSPTSWAPPRSADDCRGPLPAQRSWHGDHTRLRATAAVPCSSIACSAKTLRQEALRGQENQIILLGAEEVHSLEYVGPCTEEDEACERGVGWERGYIDGCFNAAAAHHPRMYPGCQSSQLIWHSNSISSNAFKRWQRKMG